MAYPISITTALALTATVVIFNVWQAISAKKWDPKGRHCYVTGGSAGLGLALAVLLAKKGADVSIVARNEGRLQKALAEIEAARQTPNQVLRSYSYSLNDEASSKAALNAACDAHGGRSPDAMFLCAGKATPGFFVEASEKSLREGMDNGYWIQAWSAFAGSKRMVSDNTQGKIVFVSSILGYFSIVGYSSYSPAKFALRGLAETLRSEFLLYLIDIHIFFPGTMYSPGYEEENKTKPKITLKIEESDDGLKPEQAAEALLRGVQSGHFHISGDLLGNIFRSSTLGATPHNNLLMDIIYGLIGWIGLPIWRRGVDTTIKSHRTEHDRYIDEKGLRVQTNA